GRASGRRSSVGVSPRARLTAPRGARRAGDPHGVEPLLGEGTSSALESGMLAADAIVASHGDPAEAAAAYTRAVQGGALGRKLRRLEWATRRFYGPRSAFWFGLARLSRRAQRIALAWNNGAAGWDERPGL